MTSLSSRLVRLEHSGLIHQIQTWPESEYQFRHTLVQDAADGTLLMDERQSIHLATVEALERLYRDRPDEIASILGRYFAEAQLQQVLGKAEDAGTIILQWEIQVLLVEIYKAMGDRQSSEKHRSAVTGTVRTLASSLPDSEQRQLFTSMPDVSSFLAGRSE